MFGRRARVAVGGAKGVDGVDGTDGAPPVNLRARAIGYLSRREHSRAELAAKLGRLSSDRVAIEALLDALIAENFLSERRAAQSIVRVRSARQGSIRVAGELRARGITGDLAAEMLQDLKGTEAERARALWERKFGEPAPDLSGRAKQMRFLQTRGFALDVIRAVVPATMRRTAARD